MKTAILGKQTEVIEGTWVFLYPSKKEAKAALKKITHTYSQNGKADYEIVPQSEVVVSDENYNASLNAYRQ